LREYSSIAAVPKVVGSVSDLESLRALDSDQTPEFDILEVRLDGIEKGQIDDAHWLCLRVKSWGVPILITMRDTSEGGILQLTNDEKHGRLTLKKLQIVLSKSTSKL